MYPEKLLFFMYLQQKEISRSGSPNLHTKTKRVSVERILFRLKNPDDCLINLIHFILLYVSDHTGYD